MNERLDIIGDKFTITQLAVLIRYGVLLNDKAVADFINQDKRSVQTRANDDEFPIRSQRVLMKNAKRGTRMYDFRDVADYWDSVRENGE